MDENTKKETAPKPRTKKNPENAEGNEAPKVVKAKGAAKDPVAAPAKKSVKKAIPPSESPPPVGRARRQSTKVSEEPAAETPALSTSVKKATPKKSEATESTLVKARKKPAAKPAVVQEPVKAAEEVSGKRVKPSTTEEIPDKPDSATDSKSEAPAERKPKSKKCKPADVVVEPPTTVEPPKKVRTKPRRRELKRMGLLKPKENKKQKKADALRIQSLGKQDSLVSSEPPKQKNPGLDTQNPQGTPGSQGKPQIKGKPIKSKPIPEAFEAFKKPLNEKLERKKDRKIQRNLEEERKIDQSHGLFEEPIRLNRYVALCGICSRRDADALIVAGKVKVNGRIVKEMGFKVQPGKDKVAYQDREIRIKVFVYLLMNKPKNRITTTEDERGRDTVMEIAERYTKVRVYPVGRLDRNTTGLLLLTNDGDLTQKLTHPRSKFPKLYHVRLDKEINQADLGALKTGFDLEDGFIKADKVELMDDGNPNEILVQIHSGANHVVKRMMAHLGYEVIALDRIQFGPLNKKGLPRGTCRLLTEKEIGFLKML
ncbi:MAG: hypothetical protein RLZZ165_2306 [Bacteroidota bacterium]